MNHTPPTKSTACALSFWWFSPYHTPWVRSLWMYIGISPVAVRPSASPCGSGQTWPFTPSSPWYSSVLIMCRHTSTNRLPGMLSSSSTTMYGLDACRAIWKRPVYLSCIEPNTVFSGARCTSAACVRTHDSMLRRISGSFGDAHAHTHTSLGSTVCA